MRALFLVLVAFAVACSKPPPPAPDAPDAAPATRDLSILKSLPAKDVVGYFSGNYHTLNNHPAMYADLDRKVFVMMGGRGSAELPLAKPADAVAAFEQFLVLHGYAANGAKPTDSHPKIMIDGKEMVVVTTDELFPQMPAELKRRFTPEQLDLLDHMGSNQGYALVAAKYPLMYAYSEMVVVLGPGVAQEFPVGKASDAFVAYERLLPATK